MKKTWTIDLGEYTDNPKNVKRLRRLMDRVDPLDFETAKQGLLNADKFLFRDAKPPKARGVYAFYYKDALKYIGLASGNDGLADRMGKHDNGDDGHALHRVFGLDFPVKKERRAHFLEHVSAQWWVLPYPFDTNWRTNSTRNIVTHREHGAMFKLKKGDVEELSKPDDPRLDAHSLMNEARSIFKHLNTMKDIEHLLIYSLQLEWNREWQPRASKA